MPLSALYSDTVLEHNRAPRNSGALSSATHRGEGHNASCGDRVLMQVEVSAAGHVLACCFEGDSCAICTAAASMLTDAAVGKNQHALTRLRTQFEALLCGQGWGAAGAGAAGGIR